MTIHPWTRASTPALLACLALIACHKPATPTPGAAAAEAAQASAATTLGPGGDDPGHYSKAEYMVMHPTVKPQATFHAMNMATVNPAAIEAAKPAIPAHP